MAFYDSYATAHKNITPFGKWMVWGRIRKMVRFVSKHMDFVDKKVLEIGPGRGEIAFTLREKGADMHLIEPSDGLAEILRENGFRNIEQYFIPPIKGKDNSYDLVIMDNMFEHLHNDANATAVLKEISRVVKPGGLLMIHTPEILSWGIHFYNGDYTHNYPTSRKRLEQMMNDYGFDLVENKLFSGPMDGNWTLFLGFLARCQFWIEWLPSQKMRNKLNKLRNSFLVNVFVIAKLRE